MAMFENFPYTDMHNLNLDWIIKIAKDFLDQYTHIQQLIADGEASLQNLTEEGLQQLQDKADNLESLLQAWYDSHSEDIANQLASALADLNSWYTSHSNDISNQLASALQSLNTQLTNNIAAFNQAADAKTASSIASIPADYTTLAKDVQTLEAKKANKKMITGSELGTRSSGMVGVDGSTSSAGNHVEATITGFSFYYINGFSFNSNFPLYYIKNSNGDVIAQDYPGDDTAVHDLLIYTPAGSTTIYIDGQGSGANQSKIINITKAFDFPELYDKTRLIETTALANNTDFDTLTTNLETFFGNGNTYTNVPMQEGYLKVTNYGTGLYTQEIYTLGGSQKYFRAYYSSRWHDWNPEEMYISPDFLPTDATSVISTFLTSARYLKFGKGTVNVSGLDMPHGAMIEGSGPYTVFRLPASVTSGYAIKMTGSNIISNIRVSGDTTDHEPVQTIGTRNGIVMTGSTVQTNRIVNVTIDNFNGRGLYLSETGPNHRDCLVAENLYITNCDAGICIENSEYNRISNTNIYYCWYGCINNGGNNIFTACTFHAYQCFMMDNTSEAYPNNSHGSCIGCSFNHALGNSAPGDYGILIEYATNGFIFSGCQIFYSKVYVGNSAGIAFNACLFGPDQSIAIVDTTEGQINGCIFAGDNDHMPTIRKTSSTVQVVNSYNKVGTQIT